MYITAGIWAWVGCTEPAQTEDATSPDGPGDTDGGPADSDPTDVPTGDPQASCALSANPLVLSCTASLPEPGPATLVLSAPGAPTRTFEVTEARAEHELWGWGLLPETTYDWSLAGLQGTVTTGALPEVLAAADITVSGTLFGMDAVFVYLACGYFAMIDGAGQIIWALPTEVYDALPDGMLWSPETQSVLAISDSTMTFDQSLYVETHLSGAQLARLEPGDFELDLTHDVGRWGPYTYLLGEEGGIGGFEVFEGQTRLGSVSLVDYYGGLQGLNLAHVNGLVLTEDGEAVMSLHGFDSALGIDADPLSPTFGELRWMALGAPGGGQDLPDPDYLPAEGIAFRRQHNVSRHGQSLWVFDNMSQEHSRALQLTLDDTDGSMREQASWSVGKVCMAQGGAIPIEGGVLATCATSAEVFAFRQDSKEPDWTMHATCGLGAPLGSLSSSTRAFPVQVR
jgi:hypothetical protein